MKVILRRTVRTQSSDQFAIFDGDQRDAEGRPAHLGKLDLHYDPDGAFGTLLLWSEFTRQFSSSTLQTVIDEVIEEATAAVGIPADHNIEYFSPPLSSYAFYSNYEDFDEELADFDGADED